jgi:GNAT superfamily N-acetyltransferase
MLKTEALVTTYLQMRSHLELRKSKSEIRNVDFEIQELSERDWRFNRDMYFRVGEKWKWIDKRPWTDEQWKEYANDPNLRTFAGYYGGEVAGYFELLRSSTRGQQFAGANPTAGGRELFADRPTESGDSVLVKTERSDVRSQINQSEVEIAYFGLLSEFIGRGLGGDLLTSAIENVWAWSPAPIRVWVHTCNRDHPGALNNYKARGFCVYKVERQTVS